MKSDQAHPTEKNRVRQIMKLSNFIFPQSNLSQDIEKPSSYDYFALMMNNEQLKYFLYSASSTEENYIWHVCFKVHIINPLLKGLCHALLFHDLIFDFWGEAVPFIRLQDLKLGMAPLEDIKDRTGRVILNLGTKITQSWLGW